MSILTMFSYHFIQRALIVGVLVSLCAALLGVSLVLKRYSMIGDGLSHVGFGALAVASAFHLAPLAVAVPVVVLSAILRQLPRQGRRRDRDHLLERAGHRRDRRVRHERDEYRGVELPLRQHPLAQPR